MIFVELKVAFLNSGSINYAVPGGRLEARCGNLCRSLLVKVQSGGDHRKKVGDPVTGTVIKKLFQWNSTRSLPAQASSLDINFESLK